MVIIRGAASTNRISHGVISLKLTPQPCVLSLTAAYYPVMIKTKTLSRPVAECYVGLREIRQDRKSSIRPMGKNDIPSYTCTSQLAPDALFGRTSLPYRGTLIVWLVTAYTTMCSSVRTVSSSVFGEIMAREFTLIR